MRKAFNSAYMQYMIEFQPFIKIFSVMIKLYGEIIGKVVAPVTDVIANIIGPKPPRGSC